VDGKAAVDSGHVQRRNPGNKRVVSSSGTWGPALLQA
jgi:hypothetical protein